MSAASPSKRYDVFISFRGEDTRKTFMPQLHQALMKKNLETYIDYNLTKGVEVGSALDKAIQESHISIVIFSENYATSKWCLAELVQILKCRKQHGLVVIPVFYGTDPSDVRKQKGAYETPFSRYEVEVASHIVCDWKAALTQAAGISGWDSRTYRDDSELIKDIVEDVWKKLSFLYPNELKDLVQIDEKNKDIESLLKKYQKIGIWGMGGMGKTTIAKQMFAKNFAQYDSACLLENVREESQQVGASDLRNKLFRELLKRPITTSEVVGLHKFIKARLSSEKVFIVLDDVDDAEQFDDLYREFGVLRPESRLIITTRNKDVLSGRVDEIYQVKDWKLEESKKLFCLHAFEQNHPKVNYEDLSNRAVAYARGVPLALKVLGSYFRSKDRVFWESKLIYLEKKEESFDKILNVLRVSYDGLSGSEKDILLDIAFFFKDENEDVVKTILDACDFNATCGIRILEEKALITISNDKRLQMHDLVQEMAFNIVRYKNGHASRRKRSRLRDIVEVCDILKGSHNKVEGIIFDFSQKGDLHVRIDAFNMMTKLRILKIYAPLGKKRSTIVSLPEDIMPFSDKLRYLEWNGYPLKSLPHPFVAKLLVEIRLPHSHVEHLWHGMQELEKLEGLDLSECKQLIELPDLSAAPKLKWLFLSGCESLCEVQPSVYSQDTLVTLLLDGCTKLQSLMSEKHLTSLKMLNVDGCISLKEFSLSSSLIDKLDLSNTGIEILHPSIGDMNKLVSLNLEGLLLQNLPREMSHLSSLAQLRLSNCSIVTEMKLEAIFGVGLKPLKVLYLKYCCNLFELPSNIISLASLYELRLDGSNVRKLPKSIEDLLELEILSLDNCRKLCLLPKLPPHIKVLCAENCTSLEKVSSLKTFSISMTGGKKYISFKNGLKMEPDGPSLKCIQEDAILLMKIAAHHNNEVRKCGEHHGYNYNHAEVCYPGSMVPRQFYYRTTGSSIDMNGMSFPNLIGFIFSIVVSPLHEMKERDNNNNNGAHVQCRFNPKYGSVAGCTSVLHIEAISNLNMDHVFVWSNPYQFERIRYSYYYYPFASITEFVFKFCITANAQGKKLDNLFSIKECGICPIYSSEIPMLLDSMNLDDSKSESCDGVQLKLGSLESYQDCEDNDIKLIETGYEKDNIDTSPQIKNQELDLNQKNHCSHDSLISTQVNENTQEKENRDDDDHSTEIKKSNIVHESSKKSEEEIETSSHKQGQMEEEDSTNANLFFNKAMMLKSKGNEEVPTESDAELHPPVISVVKESASEGKSSEEENPILQGEPTIVPKG